MASQMRLMNEFREQAKRKIKRISAKERNRIIDSVRKISFDELLRQHIRVLAAARGECDPDTDSTVELEEVQVCKSDPKRCAVLIFVLFKYLPSFLVLARFGFEFII